MNWTHPLALYLLPAVLAGLGILCAWAEARARRRLATFAGSTLGPALAASASPARRWLKHVLLLLAVLGLGLALAGPAWGYRWEETKARGLDVLFALDTSRSMLAEDVRPNRLERSKLAILDLVAQLSGDRVGLIAFSGQAFLQCPLTHDYEAFRQTLESLDSSVIPVPGTNLAAAIAEAQASYDEGNNHRLLILITDGEDLEAQGPARARQAAADGVRIFTVGVGTAEGELILVSDDRGGRAVLKDASGKPVQSRLDEAVLRAVAESTGGFYAPLVGGGLELVYREGLAAIPREEREARLNQVAIPRYQWPLAFALGLLLLEPLIPTRRRAAAPAGSTAALALLAALLLFAPAPEAAAGPVDRAQSLYRKKEYAASVEEYAKALQKKPGDPDLLYNRGLSQLRASDYDGAVQSFQGALHSEDPRRQRDAYFNLGATEFNRGAEALEKDPEATQEAWTRSLRHFLNATRIDLSDAQAGDRYVEVGRRFLQSSSLVAVQADPPDGGQVTGGGRFLHGRTIPLEAQPAEGFQFAGWEGGEVADPAQPQTTATIQGPVTFVARFQPAQDQSDQDQSDQSDQSPANDEKSKEQSPKDSQPEDGESQEEAGDAQKDPGQPQDEKADSQEEAGDSRDEAGQPQDGSGEPREEAGGEESDAAAEEQRVPGAMSRQEARRLLESLESGEKKLPVVPVVPQNQSGESAGRDW